jgi:hypothetical protein
VRQSLATEKLPPQQKRRSHDVSVKPAIAWVSIPLANTGRWLDLPPTVSEATPIRNATMHWL